MSSSSSHVYEQPIEIPPPEVIKEELDTEMKGVSGEYLQGIREELDLFAKIRNTIAQIVDMLGDMNALSPDQHEGANFDLLLQALEARLSE